MIRLGGEGRRQLLVALIACGSLSGACSKSRESAPPPPAQATGGASGIAAPSAVPAAVDTNIYVNGAPLSAETMQQLQMLYPVHIPPGRYWYDAISGGWGREGESIAGQMLAGLALGGTLAADASRGTSGVYINGRQLTVGEKLYIEQLCQTPVVAARYWILANGVGGYEGGPAAFNLGACPGLQRQGGGSGSSTRTYCDANGACTSSGILGTMTTARF